MSRKTFKDFLSRKFPGSVATNKDGMISLPPNKDGSGENNEEEYIDHKDDLGWDPYTRKQLLALESANESVGLLGDYVEYITKNLYSGNKYTLLGGNKLAPATDRGNVINYDSNHGASGSFGSEQGHDENTSHINYSNSGIFENLEYVIDKTGYLNVDGGHDLFKDINSLATSSLESGGDPNINRHINDERTIITQTYNFLKDNSRFSPSRGGISYFNRGERNEPAEKSDSKAHALGQNEFGKNIKDTTGLDGDTDEFKFNDLKNIGTEILKEAAYKIIGTDGLRSADYSTKDVSAKKADHSPDKTSERGAFSAAGEENKIKTKRTLTSPDAMFNNTTTNQTKIFKKTIDKLKTKLEDVTTAGVDRKDISVYTLHDYSESIDRAIEMYFTYDNDNAGVLTEDIDIAYLANLSKSILDTEKSEKIQNFLDTLAVLGDAALTLQHRGAGATPKIDKRTGAKHLTSHWDVDSFAEGPATRISMSKTKSGPNSKSLAWRGSSLPAVYHLPESIVKSTQTMGRVTKQNPVKGMLTSGLGVKTYMGMDLASIGGFTKDEFGGTPATGVNKVPKALVEEIENRLEAEYVPFYFHDLRTNEIVTFHAFLSSLTDGFKASYESNTGFGRMDPVYTYSNTTRDIGFEFKVVATSEQDFDEMWFKINKLTTMLYPQWSAGEQIKAGDSKFIRPFSQIPAGSPMIRLRIGDVIKSNYSRFNLSRIFGSGLANTKISGEDVKGTSVLSWISEIGDTGFNDKIQDFQTELSKVMLKLFMIAAGSPLQIVDLIDLAADSVEGKNSTGAVDILKNVAYSLLFQNLHGGFVNPLVGLASNRLINPDSSKLEDTASWTVGAMKGDRVLLKPSMGKYYYYNDKGQKEQDLIWNVGKENKKEIDSGVESSNTNDDIKKIMIDRHLKCIVVGRDTVGTKTRFNIIVIDGGLDGPSASSALPLEGKMFNVTQDDFIIDPNWMFNTTYGLLLDPIGSVMEAIQSLIDMLASSIGLPADSIDLYTTSFEDFMHPANNSITKAFETSNGRGLAGFIESMSFNLIDADNQPWEVSYGSRAPKILNIKMGFLPVHDIAPGLDSDGFNRAPTHNVGSIMNNISDDPYNGGFEKGLKKYIDASKQSIRDFNKEIE